MECLVFASIFIDLGMSPSSSVKLFRCSCSLTRFYVLAGGMELDNLELYYLGIFRDGLSSRSSTLITIVSSSFFALDRAGI